MEIVDSGKVKQLNIRGSEDDRRALSEIASTLGNPWNMSVVVREFAQKNRKKDRKALMRIVLEPEPNVNPVVCEFTDIEIQRLNDVSRATGFQLEHIVESAMRQLIRSPEVLEEMLVGSTQRTMDNQLIHAGKEGVVIAHKRAARSNSTPAKKPAKRAESKPKAA